MRTLLILISALTCGVVLASAQTTPQESKRVRDCVAEVWDQYVLADTPGNSSMWADVERVAQQCATRIRQQATNIEADLVETCVPIPKPWRIVTLQQKQEVSARGRLNDMGAVLFALTVARGKQDHDNDAREAYQDLCTFPHALVWDPHPDSQPLGGWFWTPSEGAREQLEGLVSGLSVCPDPWADKGGFRAACQQQPPAATDQEKH